MDIPILGKPQQPSMQCPRCKSAVAFEPPVFEVVNAETVSMVVWPKGIKKVQCSSCRLEFAGLITAYDPRAIQCQLIPIQPKSDLIESLVPPLQH